MITEKQRKKLWLQGFKSCKSKLPTQNEYDLLTVKKIKECAIDGKIAVLKSDECFYDSSNYNVEGYVSEYTQLIPASYTAYRLFLKESEYLADTPYSIKIVKPKKKELND